MLESLEVAEQDLEPKDTVSKLQALLASLEAKKRDAKRSKLYNDAKLYTKKIKEVKADLEKVNVTNGKWWFTYTPLKRVDVFVFVFCVCFLFFSFVVRRKTCSFSWTTL